MKPMLEEIKTAELLAIKSIYVAKFPDKTVFSEYEFSENETWPNGVGLDAAKEWENRCLEICGINGVGQVEKIKPGELAGETYTVAGVEDDGQEGHKKIILQLVGDQSITTDLRITVYPTGEKIYQIKPYDDGGSRVIAYPSGVPASEVEKGDVKVQIYVYPAEGYTLKKTPSLLITDIPFNETPPSVDPADYTFTMKACNLKIEAEFEPTAGAVKLLSNGKYYDSIQSAFVDALDTDLITVLKDITVGAENKIRINGKHIMLMPDSGFTIKLSRKSDYADSPFKISDNASLTLAGGGGKLIIDGGNKQNVTATSPLITVSGGTLTMNSSVTLQNNTNSAGNGGGVLVESGLFTMNGGIIKGNEMIATTAKGGGGVLIGGENDSGSAFIMTGGEISGNESVLLGGGVYLWGDETSFTMKGGSITKNVSNGNAAANGGGVTVDCGSFTMQGGVISDNTANATDGGGVFLYGAYFNMKDGIISGNRALGGKNGGGVYIGPGSSFEMSGGKISSNEAKGNGGGVYAGKPFKITGGTISENTADSHGGGVYALSGGSASISGVLISGNDARYGGGIQCGNDAGPNDGTVLTIKSGVMIRGNTALMGGGVNVDRVTVDMTGGTITGNSAGTKSTERGGR
jgi:hypothetical protein